MTLSSFHIPFASALLALNATVALAQTDPVTGKPSTIIRPRTDGPNTSNLAPPAREKWDRSIPNPVVHTHRFPIGISFSGGCGPAYVTPYLFHSGDGHYVQYGYPYPLDLSFHNLQPGQTVTIPAPTRWVTGYEGSPLVEEQRRVDPAHASSPATPVSTPAPPSEPPSDEGLDALHARDYPRAIAIYERRHRDQLAVESGMQTGQMSDRTALRLLALAQVGADDPASAARTLADAQSHDPSLASRPLDGKSIFASRRELRRLVNEAVEHAKSAPSRESWELVAVLMEAEGREDVAARMRERGDLPQAPPPPKPAAPPAGPASYSMPTPTQR